jgi:hypothetical protein
MLQKGNTKEEKKKRLYGFEKRQVYHILIKAWQDYYNLSKSDKKRIMHYERIINNLQRKLGLPNPMFSLFKMAAFAFFRYNPDLFKEGVTESLIKNGMGKTIAIVVSKLPLDERPNMVQEIIRRDYAMQKYISEIKIPTKSDLSTKEDQAS